MTSASSTHAESTASSSSKFPRLQSATFEPVESEIEVSYKSGAYFKGHVLDHKRKGRGIFSWPNGARYEGDFVDNARTGQGLQIWADGSMYNGDFINDTRHGQGEHTWTNGESYKGQFFQDRRHGQGLYTWPDGSTYDGTLYMDRKEGYGVFRFANGNVFEGLYKEDEREGPGVLTYPDGRQDVGLWHGEKLVKICSSVPDAFMMADHKEFDYNPEEHVTYIDNENEGLTSGINGLVLNSDESDSTSDAKLSERVNEIFSVSLDSRSLAVNKEAFDKAFFQHGGSEKEDSEKVVAWNKTPSVIEMQKHAHKHRHRRKALSCNIDAIVKGDRSSFKEKGPLEQASEDLISASMTGNLHLVEDLLTSGKAHPDVGDRNGHTPLIGATVNWHMDIINCLLNHGANVNKLSDEGCSALSAGCIFFYPIETFRYNIAERYLEKPPEDNKQTHSKSSHSQPKSILSKKHTGVKKSHQLALQDKMVRQGSKEKLDKSEKSPHSSSHSVNEGNQNIRSSPRLQVRIGESDKDSKNMALVGRDQNSNMAEEPDFNSNASLLYYEIEVPDQLIERCATTLSQNMKVVGGQRARDSAKLGTARHLAVIKSERERMKSTLDLLLRRGADPNASSVPMPILFFAIKAADVEMVQTLLAKNASTSITLPKEKGGLAPLHISCAIPGEEGVQMTELLLNALADPDVRAAADDSFLNTTLMEEWSKDVISPESQARLGGRTPLQIVCARDDNYKNICRIVRLLLEHRANPDLICNGFSALALCIASGNDLAIDELLSSGADPSLPLTHGVGSALCASTNTEYEHRRPINGRTHLIDKLINAGANILAPIPIGPKRIMGTAVDYAYYMFNQDRRIAHMPYHALTHVERETYNARRTLLAHIGDHLRKKAVERERRRLEDESRDGRRSASPSPSFVYIGAGAPLPPDAKRPKSLRGVGAEAQFVTFDKAVDIARVDGDQGPLLTRPQSEVVGLTARERHRRLNARAKLKQRTNVRWLSQCQTRPVRQESISSSNSRKPLFKYCYECGRSVGVRLSACTRCKEVYYCSKACKLKAWNARHKDECIRIGGRSRSPSPSGRKGRAESPTPATHPDKGKKTTVDELAKKGLRIQVPRKGLSHSAREGHTRYGFEDGRRIHSEVIPPHLRRDPQTGVYIDNYSFV